MTGSAYWILAAAVAANGVFLFVRPRAAMAIHVLIVTSALTSDAFSEATYRYGLMFAEWFVPFCFAFVLMRARTVAAAELARGWRWVLGFYVLSCAAWAAVRGVDPMLVKDLRPALVLAHAVLLVIAFRVVGDAKLVKRVLFAALILSAATTAIAWLALATEFYASVNPFYANEAMKYRFISGGGYLGVVWLHLRLWRNLSPRAGAASVALALALVVGTGSRTLVVVALLGWVAAAVLEGRTARMTIAAAACVALLVYQLAARTSELSDDPRLTEGLSWEGAVEQLERRFEPGLVKVVGMSAGEVVVGRGMGETFFIPWFAHTDLEPESIELDNCYLTFFVKYGLVGLAMLAYVVWLVASAAPMPWRVSAYVFLGAAFMTAAIPYELAGIGYFGSWMLGGWAITCEEKP